MDWLNTIASKRNQEWMILYISGSEGVTKNPMKFLTGKSGVYDKIRTDFNTKRDRYEMFISDNLRNNLIEFDTDA